MIVREREKNVKCRIKWDRIRTKTIREGVTNSDEEHQVKETVKIGE